VKGAVDAIASHLESVDVIVHHNKLTDLLRFLPFGGYLDYARRFTKDKLLNFDGKPENVRIHLISKPYFPPSSKNPMAGDMFAREIIRVIEKEKIEADLIHSHFLWPSGYIGAKLKESLDIPLIVTGHGYDVYDLPFRSSNWKEKISWVLSKADAITVTSNPNKRILEDLGAKKVHLVSNGVSRIFKPLDREEARKRLGIPVKGKVILNVGNLTEIKGHKYLIRALKIVKDRGIEFTAYLVGEGHLKSMLKKLASSLGSNEVRLVGYRPHNEIPLWMSAADLFVLPSLNESRPTVMLEALASGTPFVGTRVGGIPEVINEEVGMLVEPGQAEALAEAITRAIKREWDRDAIAQYGSQFYWDRIALRYIEIYRSLIRNSDMK